LLETDTEEDEEAYSNNKTLLYAPAMSVTIDKDRYSNYVT
jgi:hypothetical protein